jgi:thiol-disulfide isomerase/thioredoxin
MKKGLLVALTGLLAVALIGCAAQQAGVKPAAKPAAKPAVAAPAAPAAPATPAIPATVVDTTVRQVAAAPVLKLYPGMTKYDPLTAKRPVVLLLTASSCSICQKELGEVKSRYAEISKLADFYAVSEDFNAEKVLPGYLEGKNFPFGFLVDDKFGFGISLGLSFTPATIVFSQGKMVYKKAGYNDGDIDLLISALKKL